MRSSDPSRNYRKLTSNFIALSLVKATDYLVPLVTLPYIARVIGVEKFGVIIFSQSFVQYFVSLVEYGFNFSGTRAVALHRDNRTELEALFSRIYVAKITLAIGGFSLFAILTGVVPSLREQALLHLLTFGLVFGEALLPTWFFQGMEQMQFLTFLNGIAKFFFAAVLFLFVKSPDDFILVNLFYAAGAIMAGILGLILVVYSFGIRLCLPSVGSLIHELQKGFPLFVSIFMPTLYNNTSTFILGLSAPPTLVGYYAAAMKIINLVTQLITVLSRVFYPFLSRHANDFSLIRRTLLGTGGVLAFLLITTATPLVLLLFSNRFAPAIPLLRILAVGIFMLSVMAAYGTNYLLVLQKDRLYMMLTLVASLVGFAATVILIPLWHHYGAAWTLTGTRTLLAILCFLSALHLMRKKPDSSET